MTSAIMRMYRVKLYVRNNGKYLFGVKARARRQEQIGRLDLPGGNLTVEEIKMYQDAAIGNPDLEWMIRSAKELQAYGNANPKLQDASDKILSDYHLINKEGHQLVLEKAAYRELLEETTLTRATTKIITSLPFWKRTTTGAITDYFLMESTATQVDSPSGEHSDFVWMHANEILVLNKKPALIKVKGTERQITPSDVIFYDRVAERIGQIESSRYVLAS